MTHYSIDQHQRLRPKPSSKNKKKITEIEREYLEWCQWQIKPCIVCGTIENIEWHHIKRDSTDRKKHTSVIPLCEKHHKGSTEFSAHGTPKLFRETYSMEFQRELGTEIFKEFSEARV